MAVACKTGVAPTGSLVLGPSPPPPGKPVVDLRRKPVVDLRRKPVVDLRDEDCPGGCLCPCICNVTTGVCVEWDKQAEAFDDCSVF